MKKTILSLVGILIIALTLGSCASRKDVIYLQDVDDSIVNKINFTSPTFKPDDRITINISADIPELARPYNLFVTSFNTGGLTATGQQQQQSYLVDVDGFIRFPKLGKINVLGKTRIELEEYLEERLKSVLPKVKANVQLVNFRISILGEVSKPGEYKINRDKISVLQAISKAGDLTIHGRRDHVKLMRETSDGVVYYNLDLKSKDIVNSPAFYLKQNDVLYIEPNKPRVNASASSPTASYIISATGLLITIISILTN